MTYFCPLNRKLASTWFPWQKAWYFLTGFWIIAKNEICQNKSLWCYDFFFFFRKIIFTNEHHFDDFWRVNETSRSKKLTLLGYKRTALQLHDSKSPTLVSYNNILYRLSCTVKVICAVPVNFCCIFSHLLAIAYFKTCKCLIIQRWVLQYLCNLCHRTLNNSKTLPPQKLDHLS